MNTQNFKNGKFTLAVVVIIAVLRMQAQQAQGPTLHGFVDLHTHPLTNIAFGGKLIYGGNDVGALLPADPNCNAYVTAQSEEQALGNDNSTHGGFDLFSNRCGDSLRALAISSLEEGTGASQDEVSGGSGYPDFSRWPVWDDVAHQKMWVEWIRRAYQGGLRVMVALATNNKTLGDMTAGPGDLATDDKSSADLQIPGIKNFVSRHSDFMQIALTPDDAFQIVSANKLAVVIGVEIDHIGNFQVAKGVDVPDLQPPSDADVEAEIDRLFNEGVRYIFPIHLLDNAFGGSAAYMSLFDASNVRESGHPYSLVCASPSDNIEDHYNGFTYDNSVLGALSIAGQLLKLGIGIASIPSPNCPQGIGQKNSLGLTPSGMVAIKAMMQHGMLIDIDHMSQEATDQALALAVAFGYPVNSGHNGLRGASPSTITSAPNHNERALRADQYATIGKLHGMAGVGSGGLDAREWLAMYQTVIQAMGGGAIAGGFGTDTNGLATGMPPRADAAGKPATVTLGPQYGDYEKCISTPPCTATTVVVGKNGTVVTIPVSPCDGQCRKQFPNAFITIPATPDSVQYSSSFPASTDGNRTWNYITDGVAHYGMLWDFLQDVRTLPGGANAIDNNFMSGADYFVATWRIAQAKSGLVK